MPLRNGANHRNHKQTAFYMRLLRLLVKSRIEFRVGGTCAVNEYVGWPRETKDLDVFCRAGDYPRLLKVAADAGFKTETIDERWLAKIYSGKDYCDVIFGSANLMAPISNAWLKEVHRGTVHGVRVKLLPPTELIFSKSFIIDRNKYDGNDIAHIILKQHRHINWKRLLFYMDQHWEVLMMHLVHFRYSYPSERDLVPRWLLDELVSRLQAQRAIPPPRMKVCRGRVFSRPDFQVDVERWGFADLVGDGAANE